MKHIDRLKVSMNDQSVGVLVAETGNKIWFEYDAAWLAEGFDLSPQTLSFSSTAQLAKAPLFDGLHGVFSDSLPDGWGLLLMDRELKRRFDWSRHEITPLDRLAYIGGVSPNRRKFRHAKSEPAADTRMISLFWSCSALA